MRFFIALSSFLLLSSATAQSPTSCSATPNDAAVVEFGWALSSYLDQFYSQKPLNNSFLDSATNSATAEYVFNFQGIQRRNLLAVRAAQILASRIPNVHSPGCNFTFPPSPDGQTFVQNALTVERAASGAFVGLAAYTRSPEVSFLMSRLASERAAHAYYLAAQQMPVDFLANSTSLIQAYSPQHVLRSGNRPGNLGQFLHGCLKAPPSPCGLPLGIGPLGGSFGPTSASITTRPTMCLMRLFWLIIVVASWVFFFFF
jgi:hypothetical protein